MAIGSGLPNGAYLELAQRRGLPLATSDAGLQRAARAAGVTLLYARSVQSRTAGRGNRVDQANPMLHAGDSWDIAEAIVYVASQAGKFITGELLNVDGGQQCWGDPWFAGRPPYFELDYPVSRQGTT